jgi:mono/diheme cytochrome c family protein
MKVIENVWILLLVSTTLFSNSEVGKGLFDKNCAKCHAEILGIVNNGGYDNTYITPAPYVVDLVTKLKEKATSQEKFTEFIKEYIQNPDKRKSLYGKRAIKKFGLMPSLKGLMSDDEIEGLANYLYQNY